MAPGREILENTFVPILSSKTALEVGKQIKNGGEIGGGGEVTGNEELYLCVNERVRACERACIDLHICVSRNA